MVKLCTSFVRGPVVVRVTAVSPRYAALGRHDPTLKRKKKMAQQQKKKPKKTSRASKKPVEVFPPVDPEAFVDRSLFQAERRRELSKISEEEKERRILLLKEWSRYRNRQQREELRKLQEVISSRELALRELKKVSEWHYEEAIKTDEELFPLHLTGPTETPPVANYIAPDAIE